MAKMKKILVLFFVLLVYACSASAQYVPQDGDIIFQTSLSCQSYAIQTATKSRYSHVGIVYLNQGAPYVYEAVGPVKTTPLDQWIKRGEKGHFVVKRLKNANDVLTGKAVERMKSLGARYEGKPYDLTFEWSDDRIYCSELVWKIYKQALNIEIGTLQKMEDFDLSDPKVRFKVKERFGDNIPLEETVISPASIFNSSQLIQIHGG
jgi:uncharacterized protein YycO